MTSSDHSSESEKKALSGSDEELISRAVLISQIVQQRLGETPAPASPKTLSTALKEPALLAALITVLIGGIAATVITGIIQWRAGVREFDQSQTAREREFDQMWLNARGDQALVSYKEYLDQEKLLMTRAYSSIGNCISASDRLAGLTKAVWRGPFRNRAAVDKQTQEIIDNYNQTGAKWQREGPEIGLLIGYYHPSENKIPASWENVETAVGDYLKCGRKWYDGHIRANPPPSDDEVNVGCKPAKDALMANLKTLTSDLESARRFAWSGWESPTELKRSLGIKSP